MNLNLNWNEHRSKTHAEKKRILIAYGQEFHKKYGTAPTIKDLNEIGISYMQLRYLFTEGEARGNLRDYHLACGLASNIREKNMSKEEMKQYVLDMPRTNDENCPANMRKDPICFPTCTCWIPTNRYITENNRSNIRYDGKIWLLHRLSYALFKEDIPATLGVLHTCDSPRCYNSAHLKAGDKFENRQHCVAVGRAYTGVKKAVHHNLSGPYDPKFVDFIKSRCEISPKNEWLYKYSSGGSGYPTIMIANKHYTMSKLMLAHKLNKKYEEIDIARHLLPGGTEGQRHDLNPDHLIEGSRKDNANDSLRNNMDVSAENITYIRTEAASRKLKRGEAQLFDREMSAKFGVSESTITNIRLGVRYKAFHDGSSIGATKTTPVIQYDLSGNLVREYASVTEALKVNDYKSMNMIQDVCNGISRTYKGFVWKYKT